MPAARCADDGVVMLTVCCWLCSTAHPKAKLDGMIAAAKAAGEEAHREMVEDEQELADAQVADAEQAEVVAGMAAEMAEQQAVQRMTLVR